MKYSYLDDAYNENYPYNKDAVAYENKTTAYDVKFESHTFNQYDRCAGQYDFKTRSYRQFTEKEADECCRIVSNILQVDPSVCDKKYEV